MTDANPNLTELLFSAIRIENAMKDLSDEVKVLTNKFTEVYFIESTTGEELKKIMNSAKINSSI